MKIARATSRVEAIPLARPYSIAFRRVEAVELPIVALEDDRGRIGLGAASPERHVTGETNAACAAALSDDRLAFLMGADVRDRGRLTEAIARELASTPAARAAVDMALWDLYAHDVGRPLVELFGQVHAGLPTSITIGIKNTDEALAEADEYLGRGFRILKVKLGHDVEADVERVSKLREHVGAHVGLRVDPNQGYDLATLQRFLGATATLDLELVEQPVKVAATDTLRTLPDNARARVCLDEALLTEGDAVRYAAKPRPAEIWNIKLMKCGGVTAARRIAAVAEAGGLTLMWGCMDESRISIAAALHTALASPATRFLDLDGSFDLARDVAEGGFVLEKGVMRPAPGAGLGLSVSER